MLLGRLRRERRLRRPPPGRGVCWTGAPAIGEEPGGAPGTLGRGPRGRRRRGLMALPRFGAGSAVGMRTPPTATVARVVALWFPPSSSARRGQVQRLEARRIASTRWPTIGPLPSDRSLLTRSFTGGEGDQRGDETRGGERRLNVSLSTRRSRGLLGRRAAIILTIDRDVQPPMARPAQARFPECHSISATPSR